MIDKLKVSLAEAVEEIEILPGQVYKKKDGRKVVVLSVGTNKVKILLKFNEELTVLNRSVYDFKNNQAYELLEETFDSVGLLKHFQKGV